MKIHKLSLMALDKFSEKEKNKAGDSFDKYWRYRAYLWLLILLLPVLIFPVVYYFRQGVWFQVYFYAALFFLTILILLFQLVLGERKSLAPVFVYLTSFAFILQGLYSSRQTEAMLGVFLIPLLFVWLLEESHTPGFLFISLGLCFFLLHKTRFPGGGGFDLSITFQWSFIVVYFLLSGGVFLNRKMTCKLLHRLNRDETRLSRANKEILRLEVTDPLTGCYNRRYLKNNLIREVTRTRRFNEAISIIFCEVDDFKPVKTEYGHAAEEMVLSELGGFLLNTIRQEVDWVVRYSDIQFLLILPNTDLRGALSLARRIRALLKEKAFSLAEEVALSLSLSYGITWLPHQGCEDVDMEELILSVDMFLYQARKSGGGGIAYGEVKEPDSFLLDKDERV